MRPRFVNRFGQAHPHLRKPHYLGAFLGIIHALRERYPRSTNSVDMGQDLWELTALSLLAGLGFGFALAHGDLLFAAFWRCHRNDGGRRRLVKGALAMSKVAVYIAFVLSTAWLLFGSWQPPQTVSGNHSGHEATNDYWQDAPRAPTTDEGETKVLRADGEQEE